MAEDFSRLYLRSTVTLIFTPAQLSLIKSHAERTYPDECCGLLIGRLEADDRSVVAVQPTENAWGDEPMAGTSSSSLTKSRRYWIAPEEMLKGMRSARDQGLEIIGIYHSHPDHPAAPSECDRQLAWSTYSYLIVSVPQGKADACSSWRLDDGQQFQPEMIHIVQPANC